MSMSVPDKVFSIAIDGPAGAGKSSIAKALAREINAQYVDTGAMYRAIALGMQRKDVICGHKAAEAYTGDIDINVKYLNGNQHVFLGEEDVSHLLHEPSIAKTASVISQIPSVRKRLVQLQREIAEAHNVVMDGRDVGTIILPDATLKVYLTASVTVRANRRYKELREMGLEMYYEQVLQQIIERDYQDIHRTISPLRKAADAILFDTSTLTLSESVGILKRLAFAAINKLE